MRKLTKVNNNKSDSIERYNHCYKKTACETKYVCYCNNILCNIWSINAGGGIPQTYSKTVTVYAK